MSLSNSENQLEPPFPFAEKEYEDRIQRFKADMQRRELDVMLLFANHSFFYLYGYDMAAGAAISYQTIIAPLDGGPVAFVRNTMAEWVSHSPFLNDIRTYDTPFDDDNAKMTVEILADLNLLSGKRIGIEKRSLTLNAYDYDLVREQVERGGGQLVDASDLVMELRIHKSPAEVAYMRQAGHLYDVVMEATFAAMKPGIRECDVNAEALHALYSAGGEDVAQPLMIVPAVMSRTNMLPPTRRMLMAGEPMFIEAGACFNRYHAVGGTTVACGAEPGKEMLEAFARARDAIDVTRSLIKPGVSTADVIKAVIDVRDIKDHEAFHAGYGIGIGYRYLWHEDLIIRVGDEHVLEENMTLSLFGFATIGEYFFIVSDPVVITTNGFDDLSTLPRDELRVVGA